MLMVKNNNNIINNAIFWNNFINSSNYLIGGGRSYSDISKIHVKHNSTASCPEFWPITNALGNPCNSICYLTINL